MFGIVNMRVQTRYKIQTKYLIANENIIDLLRFAESQTEVKKIDCTLILKFRKFIKKNAQCSRSVMRMFESHVV